ncbi:MAG: hypothetical protein WD847_14005 [Pirellulales bacterium]
MLRTLFGLAVAFAAGFLGRSSAQGGEAPLLEKYLIEGKLAEGHQALSARLAERGDDAQARFGLGVLEILQAVERLAQSLHEYGLRSESPNLPFVRLPVPKNPEPAKITYEAWRGVFQQLIDDLSRAQETLAKVDDDDVKLPIRVGLVRLDLDGDGKAGDDETFWRVFTAVAWRAAKLDNKQQEFRIGFDKADVHWMIGYTYLLRALAEGYLAHDTEQFFNGTAHLFFAGAESPYAGIGSGSDQGQQIPVDSIAEAVLAIHLFSFEPAEPQRLQRAHGHLLSMIDQSRKCWHHAMRETDDDREWIPNARQTSLTPLTVTPQRVQSWKRFLDEAEAILQGEKLVPHWRIRERGVNLRRVFHEPTTFDLVKWVHGAAAVPYLEDGPRTDRQTWRQLSAAFEGRFLAFAVWFQ